MANFSVDELQARIASIVDESSSSPTQGGDDWNLRLKYLNMAQHEASELIDWDFLYKEYGTLTSTSTGNTSITLPTDFRKLATFPRVSSGGVASELQEVRAQERSNMSGSDKYVYILGNPYSGYVMVVNPGTSTGQLTSGASILVPYYASVQSLASASDIPMIPDSNYLVSRTVAYLWEAREDGRYPGAKAEAEKILQRMLERETVHSEAALRHSRVRTVDERYNNFR